MQQCQIYDRSLRFSRATYGLLLLLAVVIKSQWLVLAIAILILIGVFTLKLNIPYQLHMLLIAKKKAQPVAKELAELNFVATATAILILVGFCMLYFNIFSNAAWIYLLVVDLMIFLACFVGFCVATMMYIFIRKMLDKPNAAKEIVK